MIYPGFFYAWINQRFASIYSLHAGTGGERYDHTGPVVRKRMNRAINVVSHQR
jgi:hypothetical protein